LCHSHGAKIIDLPNFLPGRKQKRQDMILAQKSMTLLLTAVYYQPPESYLVAAPAVTGIPSLFLTMLMMSSAGG
jgi:hypothetical protein